MAATRSQLKADLLNDVGDLSDQLQACIQAIQFNFPGNTSFIFRQVGVLPGVPMTKAELIRLLLFWEDQMFQLVDINNLFGWTPGRKAILTQTIDVTEELFSTVCREALIL